MPGRVRGTIGANVLLAAVFRVVVAAIAGRGLLEDCQAVVILCSFCFRPDVTFEFALKPHQ